MPILFSAILVLVLHSLSNPASATEPSPGTIRLATTTSVQSSGLLDYLIPLFSEHQDFQFVLSVVGSGRAMKMARKGEVDLIWVHSPEAEQQFIDEGYGHNRRTVMRNDFVLVGPDSDPASIKGRQFIQEALTAIFQTKAPFISRGDDSGTHRKELKLWQVAGKDPVARDWYIEAGLGMAMTLALAQTHQAYMLIDKATFVVRKPSGMSILLEADPALENFYSIISVNPDKVPGVQTAGARQFSNWLLSPGGQAAIDAFNHHGESLYQPVAQ